MHDDSFRVISLVADPAGLAASVLSGNDHRPEVLRLRRSPIGSDGFVHRRSCFRFQDRRRAVSLADFHCERDSNWQPVGGLPRSNHGPFDSGRFALTSSSCAIVANDRVSRNRHGDEHVADVGIDSVYATVILEGRSTLSDIIGMMVNP